MNRFASRTLGGLSSFVALAWAAGCGVDGSLTFIPDEQFNGSGQAGGAGAAGAAGGAQGGSSGGAGGASGGEAGQGGGKQIPPECLTCAQTECTALTMVCQQDPACVACVIEPTPACMAKPDVIALQACLCGKCDGVCAVAAKCGAGGAGGAGGKAGKAGAGQGGDAGGGQAGAGGAGQGGSSGGAGGDAGAAGASGAGMGGASGSAGKGGGGGVPVLGDPCSPDGAVACNGHASSVVMKCVDSIWSSNKTCPSGQLCDTAAAPNACAPVVPACQGKKPGDVVCDGADRVTCGLDLVTSTKVTCGSAALCQLGSADKCAVCEDNEHVCSGTKLRVCKADHSGFEDKQTCATVAECNPDAGACTDKVCIAGSYKCVGDELQKCKADESGFAMEAACGAGMCNQALGQCNTCTPGAESCGSSSARATCGADGKTVTSTPCDPATPFCIGQGQCVQCQTASDCGSSTACQDVSCDANACKQSNKPNGTATTDPTANDCSKLVCDGQGREVPAADPNDLPKDDGNPCTNPACGATGPTFNSLPDGTSCNGSGFCAGGVCGSCQVGSPASCVGNQVATCVGGQYQLTACPGSTPYCTGQGTCVACTTSAHCGSTTECAAPTCSASGTCSPGYKPNTTQLSQTPNDCLKRGCDGVGNVVTVYDSTDLPLDDGNPCTAQTCTTSGPKYDPLTGNPCPGGVCSNGACVACVEGSTRCNDDLSVGVCQGGQWVQGQSCASVGSVCRQGGCTQPYASCNLGPLCTVSTGSGGTGGAGGFGGGTVGVLESCCTSQKVTGGDFYRGQNGAGVDTLGKDDRYTGPDKSISEAPETVASIAPFMLDKYEVTVGRFRMFVGAFPYYPGINDGQSPNVPGSGWSQDWNGRLPTSQAALITQLKCSPTYQTWTDMPGMNETKPINCVTWYVAEAFCLWDGGRLPFEAEWERAATAGTEDRILPFVDTNITCGHTNSKECGFLVHDVGGSPLGISADGLVDLAGNVAEWTFDLSSAYPTLDCFGPGCVNKPPLSGANFNASVRGGSFSMAKLFGRSAARVAAPSGTPSEQIGIRCARSQL